MRDSSLETTYLGDIARAWASGVQGVVPAPTGINARRFMDLFEHQAALLTLASHLDRAVLSPAARESLDGGVAEAQHRTVMMLLELERLLPALAEIGCRPVVLKGASLALTVYPRPEQRWFMDLDLLVTTEKLTAVCGVLESLGYRFARGGAPLELYDRYHFHRIMVNNQGVCVEVHWAVTLPNSVYSFNLEAMRNNAVEIPLGTASFLAPSVVDQILHGVLQSIAGGFNDLRRILDLHVLDGRITEAEMAQLCERARASNLSTGLWLQYHLRSEILGLDSPPSVQQLCPSAGSLAVTLDRLDVVPACLGRRKAADTDLVNLLHWICVPPHRRGREIRRFIFPDKCSLMIEGNLRQGTIPFWKRGRLVLARSLSAVRLIARWMRAAV